jgi:acyl carrier protein
MNPQSAKDITETIQKMAIEILGVTEMPTGSVREALDSMNRLALMVEIEDHFKIVFEPEEEDAIHTFEDLVQCIEQKLMAQ